jgi:hypothetical protein
VCNDFAQQLEGYSVGEMIQEEKECDRQRDETSKARRILGKTRGSDK